MESFEIGEEQTKKRFIHKKGVKRALILLCVLKVLGCIHTLIQRLSDDNVNKLFDKLFSEMKAMMHFQNITSD